MPPETRKVREFARREQDILRVAAELFGAEGERTISMEKLAGEVGVSVGTIYQHFKNKNEIYAHLFIEKDLERLRHISNIDRTLPVLQQIRVLARNYVDFYFENPLAYRVLVDFERRAAFEKLGPELSAKVKRQRELGMEFTENILRRALEQGAIPNMPPAFAGCASWALFHGSLELMLAQYFDGKIDDWHAYFSFAEDLLIAGLVGYTNSSLVNAKVLAN